MYQPFTCECGATAMGTCRCFFPESGVLTFDDLLEYCMQGRRPRHWLANRDYTFARGLDKDIENARNGNPNTWQRLCQFAISGSTICQKALLDLAEDDQFKVIEELNRALDYFDEYPVCDVCTSTDICGCKTNYCPACNKHACKAYACRMHLPGAKEAYLKTIGAEVPVRRRPTAVMNPVTDTMRNAAVVLFDSCALPFPSRDERGGLEHCAACDSYECEHCICIICKKDECEHFFMLPRMNPALDVAWRNAEWPYRRLDGRCFCKTCNTKFWCPDWDINPSITCCSGDCEICPECIRKEVLAGRRRY